MRGGQQHEQHQQDLLLHHNQSTAAAAAAFGTGAGGGGHQPKQRAGSRLVKGVGEIVEVQGGHIVRSTGRKDRHSKVCTAKGPRDRRVRLSAHTAIKFYDVQDRLGYDRPSKAVDWLIKNAKAAIDELAQLPPWDPVTAAAAASTSSPSSSYCPIDQSPLAAQNQEQQPDGAVEAAVTTTTTTTTTSSAAYDYGGSALLPPALESDAIADTIKSFFPVGTGHAGEAAPGFPPDLLSRTSSYQGHQDLRLSLHSFHDVPVLLQHQPHHHHNSSPISSVDHQAGLFSPRLPASLPFDEPAAWLDANQTRLGRWNSDESAPSGGQHLYGTQHLLHQALPLYPVLAASSYLSRTRGTLQSSTTNNSHPVRQWADGMPAGTDFCYASNGIGSFSGIHITGRMQVDCHSQDGEASLPSSPVSPGARP